MRGLFGATRETKGRLSEGWLGRDLCTGRNNMVVLLRRRRMEGIYEVQMFEGRCGAQPCRACLILEQLKRCASSGILQINGRSQSAITILREEATAERLLHRGV